MVMLRTTQILFSSLVLAPALAAQSAPPAAPLSTFDYDARLPLDARDSLRERIDGIEVRTLSFASPKGGRVTGLLYLPGTPGGHAGMIVGHGAPGNSTGYATMTLGLAMARSGAVVIALDAPFARRNAQPLTLTAADSADQVQFMIDLRRGVDYLAGRSDVDASRIGYIGNSFGGAAGTLFAGIEPRLRAAVLRVADGGWVSHFTAPCDSTRTGAAAVTGCLRFDGPLAEETPADRDAWLRAVLPLEGIRFVGRARAKLLLQNGRRDPLVPPAVSTRLHNAVPEGTRKEWYDSEHRLPNEALLSGIRFLHDELGLSLPDAAFEGWLTTRTAAPPPR